MLKTGFWTFIFLLVIEVVFNLGLQPAIDAKDKSNWHRYFDYGRSTEGKIMQLVGIDDSQADPIMRAGWYREIRQADRQLGSGKPKNRVLVYGMSFSNRIAQELGHLAKNKLDIQVYSGPAAPLNHSFAYFEKHRPYAPGDIVILGILASSLSRINSMTHMTANFEQPGAHFYPRYRINKSSQLEKVEIRISRLADLREVLRDEERWGHVKSILSENDSYYDPIIFEKNWTDESVLARLLKRAWGQKSLNETESLYHDSRGFKNTENLVEVSKALVVNFAHGVTQDGAHPYLILFNDRGFDDHLYQLLAPMLESESIPFFSTHSLFPASDRSNFVPDGHFTHEIDRQIASIVLDDISSIDSEAQR